MINQLEQKLIATEERQDNQNNLLKHEKAVMENSLVRL